MLAEAHQAQLSALDINPLLVLDEGVASWRWTG
jgi:hypothetical protein